jgi:predicted nucleotidyltransferase
MDIKASSADALFSRVQQRVLAILYGNPTRSFYANEIIRLANTGTGAVQRELSKLAGAGLLTVSRRGNQKHYQANPAAPVYDELRGLVLKTFGLVDVLRRALAPLAPKIKAAFVFGSMAKREDSATSDIDLMIVSDSLTYADLFTMLEDATTTLGRTVNPTVYTLGELEKRVADGNSFIIRVLDQPKFWVLGTEDELTTGQSERSG